MSPQVTRARRTLIAALCIGAAMGVSPSSPASASSAPTATGHAAGGKFKLEPGPAPAPPTPTAATITPSLAPNRLGAQATLTLNVTYSGGTEGVPAPLRHANLRLPAGLGLHIPKLASCSARRLRIHGPSGCPAAARIGSGRALAENRAGSLIVSEHLHLTVVLGPFRDGQPTLLILGQGYTPLAERVVLPALLLPGSAPFGEQLSLSVPTIPTMPLEPPASIRSLSLSIGLTGRSTHRSGAIVVPSRCPAGGFPFGAEFSYADGSHSDALASVPCPRR